MPEHEETQAMLWQRMREKYDFYAQSYNKHTLDHKHAGPAALAETLRQRHQFNVPAHFESVLDFGCGTGHCAEALRPISARLAGVDLSSKMLAQAKETGLYDALHLANGLDLLAAGEEKPELIAAISLLSLMGDPGLIFPAISAALPSQGIFVFNADINIDRTENVYEWRPEHFRYRPAYLAAQARGFGFTPLYGHFYDDRMIDLEGGGTASVRAICYMVQKS